MTDQDAAAAPPTPVDESPAPVTQRRPSASSDSGRDTDTFEDAQDTASVRSLNRRKPSVVQSAAEDSQSELAVAFKKIKEKKAAKEKDPEAEQPETAGSDMEAKEATPPVSPNVAAGSIPDADGKPPAAPADTKRLSQGSTNGELNDVNLDDEPAAAAAPAKKIPQATSIPSQTTTLAPAKEKSPSPERETPKTLSLSSITSALPSMPWSPPATESPTKNMTLNPNSIPNPMSAPAPAPPSRKLTSPFSWLSRNSTKEKDTPPATSPRRNTASSVATLTSNPEMMLSRLDEEGRNGGAAARNTLKDRFKLVRMREEAGVTLPGDEPSSATSKSVGGLTPIQTGSADDSLFVQPTPTSPLPASPNPSLAPGTASGVDAGPSAISDGAPVDWDLWQQVVYEGPAAVARTSSDELNRAIAVGIPNVIRGVVWQTLAQSKNEGLEHVYNELVARGTDKELPNRQSGSSVGTSSNVSTSLSIQKGETTSSASSVHSDGASSTSAPMDKEAEAAAARLAAAELAERKKREKDDKAALQKLEKVIRKDLGMRTSFSKFAASQGLQEGLYGVCKAYALFDEGVGYAQGMNFLVMPLLFNMPEEEAFCLLIRLMNHYNLRELFIHDMPGLHKILYQFERLLEDLEPALYCHLHRKGISSHLYATQWFLTLFAYRFPLQLVLRIYDLILSEGLSAILKFGVVLMQKNAKNLLEISDMSALTSFLRDRLFDVYIDASPSAGGLLEHGFFGSSSSNIDKEVYRADQMVRDACDVKITPEILAQYTEEWEEKTAAERQREAEMTRRDAEIEELRHLNAAANHKVRRLEEQLEANDTEQAELATQLVHFKVENQELRDEAESLREQAKTMRSLLQDQPAELEKAWQEEKEGLLAKMEKVREENRRIQKEMAEMEQSLVKAKMDYAEINSQHETLTRRWTDLKRQFA